MDEGAHATLDRIVNKLETIEARMHVLETELFFYKRLIHIIQWIGAAVVALITINIGDIKQLFK